MEFEFEYEQFMITLDVYCTEMDGSDMEWNIKEVYNIDTQNKDARNELTEKQLVELYNKAEKIASEEACNVALDYTNGLADFFRD